MILDIRKQEWEEWEWARHDFYVTLESLIRENTVGEDGPTEIHMTQNQYDMAKRIYCGAQHPHPGFQCMFPGQYWGIRFVVK